MTNRKAPTHIIIEGTDYRASIKMRARAYGRSDLPTMDIYPQKRGISGVNTRRMNATIYALAAAVELAAEHEVGMAVCVDTDRECISIETMSSADDPRAITVLIRAAKACLEKRPNTLTEMISRNAS